MTNAYGSLPVLAIRLKPLDTWQAQAYAHMVDRWREISPEHVITKIIENMRDLGIEPRSQYLQASSSTIQAIESLCYYNKT